MTIASALTALNTDIVNARTAITDKGGTVTANGGSSQLATDIATIPTGTTPVIQSLNVTPTTSAQTITASGGVDGYSPVNVSAVTASIDANITAGNIKNGVTILNVTGNYSGTTPTGTLSITQNGTYDVTNYASADVSVSGGGGAKYKLYDRVKDDNNNEIGTVSGFYTDSNNNEYAVVCLDAQYRLAAGAWSSTAGTATNMPLYADYTNIAIWGDGAESATTNTQLILDWCTAQGYTSTACGHCRSKYFTIDGVTYYGQLPNLSELLDIFRNHHRIEDADTSSSSAGTTLNWATEWKTILASNQVNNAKAWFINNVGSTSVYALPGLAKKTNAFICPVLEIPNT